MLVTRGRHPRRVRWSAISVPLACPQRVPYTPDASVHAAVEHPRDGCSRVRCGVDGRESAQQDDASGAHGTLEAEFGEVDAGSLWFAGMIAPVP